MDLERDAAPLRRRRGEELEQALLQAAWEQLLEGGYQGFTIDAVADRAQTSRSVIYRRWSDRDALLEATLSYGLNLGRVETPETGSLRGDMLAMMRTSNAARSAIAPLMSVFMGAYFADSGRTFADVRQRAFGERTGTSVDTILERAIARGEVDPARLTPRVRTVAADLFRHDLLMTAAPLPDDAIVAIVDEVFLPLVMVDRGASRDIP
ncbi:TetR/AcrR family transcriptional regulator [Microbacterium horticulturae]|uniref:TetR/AcrR family transcriptional regulator n=1 Tax=Microbacterium horticulturae TaxID=3028316 RepID=A0ABY8C5A3_9MICO|nr:TetR/AcrR family transcriptional regulator [Microbacterium sp. KACC 23027]WEG10507.1 TetR/AcrR family transcriptional regulator [Microbacterium sp. KACC 23027]